MKHVLLTSCLLLTSLSLAKDSNDNYLPQMEENSGDQDTYTINFNNISMVEYLRFVSRVANVNFVFDETELQFNVTIVSEESVTTKNIMSALIQVLRIHDLIILEQEGNLLITKSTTVHQIPTIVSGDLPNSKAGGAAIITRVFRIHNANLNSIATIIKPMMSSTALIEVSNETRQLIVSDITTNVDKIGALLASLDAPHSPLDIDSYNAKHIPLDEMIEMTTKILSPFSEGNPLIFVPQPETSTIFMVSTPYLLERALTVFADLDVPNKPLPVNATFYLYKILYRPASELQSTLIEIADEFNKAPSPPIQLVTTLKNSKWVRESNSLLFFGDEATLAKIKEILTNLDSQYHANLQYSFFIYKIQNANEEELLQALQGVSDKLKASEFPDDEVITTIDSIKWIKETNSFVFTGTPHGISQVTELLKSLDQVPSRPGKTGYSFFIYKLENTQGDVALDNIHRMAENLSDSGIPNTALVQTLNSITWVKETNSLLITGPSAAVEEAKTIISHFDIPPTKALFAGKTAFFAYKPVFRTAKEIQSDLTDMAEDLKASGLIDPNLYLTITTMRYVETNNTLLFTGPQDILDQLKSLLITIDGAQGQIKKIGELTFIIYKPKYISTSQLMTSLQNLASDLSRTPNADKDLLKSIETMRFVKETNSLLFTGTSETLTKVEGLIQKFDASAFATQGPPTASSFILYKPKYQTGPELISILCEFEQNLSASGASDARLFSSINNIKWIDKTSSLLVSGDPETVQKIETLLEKFDQPSKEGLATAIESIENTSFLVYKLQYQPGSAIQTALKQVGADLGKTVTPTNQALLNAINSLQWIQVTNSLLATGDQGILTKLKELVGSLDVPLKQVFIEVLVVSTSVTNAQNFGLQWGGQLQYLTKTAAGITNLPGANNVSGSSASNAITGALQPISATTTPNANKLPLFGQGFDLGVIGDIIMHKGKSFISLGSLIQALQTDNDSAVVFNPKIITQDNNNSTIFVGENIPYVGSNVTINSGGQANNTNITSLEYINVGFNLSLTPTLGNGDVVTLDITTNISSTSSTNANGTQGGTNGIQTDQTNMTTRVHVPDNHFVILSGLINDSTTHFKSSIPCLGGLPVIGLAFSENDRLTSKKNLIFFLRPHIISSFDDYKELTDRQENTFKANAGLPVISEEIDQFIDIVKTPENE
ncbi:MAG: hypothetical protein V4494_06780 [Chlamydiota bacterium]